MAGISSLGVGSGIDIRSLVDQLVEAERAPVANRLDRKETQFQAELSGMGNLKSALNAFRSEVRALADIEAFQTVKATSDNSDAVSVSASAGADTGSFDVEVNALAQAQATASGAFAESTTAVGSGTLTFRFGEVTTDGSGSVTGFSQNADRAVATVEIPSGATSLASIRDAVNEADVGVRASIINDGSGERLVFNAADSGAANGFVVDVSDDDGNDTDNSGLSQLAFNTSASNQSATRDAADASLVVNGLDITRESNTITDVIQGVMLDLNETTSSVANISISSDTGAVRKKIETFVGAFNSLQGQVTQLSGYDAETQQGGILQGNAVVRNINSNLRQLVTDTLGALEGRSVRSLADLGIITKRDGTMEIDSEKLTDALENSFDEVGALFASTGLVNGDNIRYESSRSTTQPGTYGVNVTQVAEQASVNGGSLSVTPSGSTPLTIDADNDNFVIVVDGERSGSISLTQGDYTSGDALAAEVQARINGDGNLEDAGVGVSVDYDSANNRLVFSSERYGSESSIEFGSVDTNSAAELGIDTSLNDTGVDVAGTIGGVAGEGFGRFLTAQSGDPNGLKVEVLGQATGSRGDITYSKGITSRLEGALNSYLDSDGLLDSVTDSLRGRIEDIGDERSRLQDRLQRIEERYIAEFSAMDTLVAQLNQTSSFLTNQLSGLESLAGSGGGGSK
ncbi:flagellar filament capping protein FliD [Ectothiorhodospiraceae bacterium WFHF3C12]|nr:flagellar filament capping protein FliD [Ectothiorhodospiraceae bacterium WFHF3C12]